MWPLFLFALESCLPNRLLLFERTLELESVARGLRQQLHLVGLSVALFKVVLSPESTGQSQLLRQNTLEKASLYC